MASLDFFLTYVNVCTILVFIHTYLLLKVYVYNIHYARTLSGILIPTDKILKCKSINYNLLIFKQL